jgi:hypothetical protein
MSDIRPAEGEGEEQLRPDPARINCYAAIGRKP